MPSLTRAVVFAILAVFVAIGCAEPIAEPDGMPVVSCTGLPPDMCQAAVDQAIAESPARGAVVAITIACSKAPCSRERGESLTRVHLASGEVFESGTAWDTAVPVGNPDLGPPIEQLPVAPICRLVPARVCGENAQIDGLAIDAGAVVSIVVACKAGRVCIDSEGEGSTVVTLVDGTTHQYDWIYQGASGP
jgi:hypothetical protein